MHARINIEWFDAKIIYNKFQHLKQINSYVKSTHKWKQMWNWNDRACPSITNIAALAASASTIAYSAAYLKSDININQLSKVKQKAGNGFESIQLAQHLYGLCSMGENRAGKRTNSIHPITVANLTTNDNGRPKWNSKTSTMPLLIRKSKIVANILHITRNCVLI